MKIAVMQPYIFPYIGYFQLINLVDQFVIYDDVNFIKKGWINRNNILSNTGIQRFTIPLKNVSQNKLINETYIDETANWKDQFLKTINHNYKKAPFFKDTYSLIENIILTDENNIGTFTYNALVSVSKYLELNTTFILSSELNKENSLKGNSKILNICNILKATSYINPIGGIDIYSKELFIEERINLYFLRPSLLPYQQFNQEFVPWLSIIDVLMFNTKEKINNLLTAYTLI
ncbi:WbqC family protein [uncultured Chryseobacterium sp.]|uniref:WbqC family protein n=1 Tax=uncultured Chryseobacterium sp. TaxID=259322 RepID=UPI0025E1170A|nr:WbqC family protein [uncultured Chryseobacterium sp.]